MISDGQRVNAAVTNAAFLSRTENSSTIGKIDLQNEGSPEVIDLQASINLSLQKSYPLQVVTTEIDSEEGIGRQFRPLVADTSSVTLPSKPFGDKDFADGIEMILLGTSASNIITLNNSDESKGVAINGTMTLKAGSLIVLKYSAQIDRFVEVSRNGL